MIYLYDETGSVCGLEVTKIHGETVTTDTYYFAKNLQGDVTAILDYQGNVVANYRYDAYGSIISVTDANGNYISSSTHIANLNPFRYRGYMYDEESGFYYLRSRYYDPYIGRFLNADVYVSTGQGLDGNNMFAYCDDNPIIYMDSTGYIKEFAFGNKYELGNGWYARFDKGLVGNKDHIHIWKDGEEWIMNLDGSMSHKNKSNKGNPPSKTLKNLKNKTGFDYKKQRKNFLKNDDSIIGFKGLTKMVYYSDGTIYTQGEYYYTNDETSRETVYENTPFTSPLSLVFPSLILPNFVGPPIPIVFPSVVYGPPLL